MLSVVDAVAPSNPHDIIRQVAADVIRLKAQKKAINEQIVKAKANVKALGVKMVDFNAAFRLLELEVEDREESLANLRLCFAALDLDPQGDLFAGANDDDVTIN